MKEFRLLKGYKFNEVSNYVLNNVFGIGAISFTGSTSFDIIIPTSFEQVPTIIRYHNNHELSSFAVQFMTQSPEYRTTFSGTVDMFYNHYISTTTIMYVYEIHTDDGHVYRANEPLPVFNLRENLTVVYGVRR